MLSSQSIAALNLQQMESPEVESALVDQLFNAVITQDLALVEHIAEQDFAIYRWAAEKYDEELEIFLNPIQKAICLKNKDIIKILLQRIPDRGIREIHIHRALETTCILGYIDLFKWFFAVFEFDSTSYGLGLLLDSAIRGGEADIVQALIRANADVNADLNWENTSNLTPLILSIMQGDIHLVKLLVEAGANVSISDPEFPSNGVLDEATSQDRLDIFDYLFPLVTEIETKEEQCIQITIGKCM